MWSKNYIISLNFIKKYLEHSLIIHILLYSWEKVCQLVNWLVTFYFFLCEFANFFFRVPKFLDPTGIDSHLPSLEAGYFLMSNMVNSFTSKLYDI